MENSKRSVGNATVLVGQFMASIGQTLGNVRRDRGLSIEDVAHETHIHSHMVKAIESDDFSAFPSVAYAKSFVRQYSEFLEVDVSGALSALNSGVSVRLADNELMGEMKKTIKKDRRFRFERLSRGARRQLKKPVGSPFIMNVVLLVLIGAMGIFYFLGYDTSSPEEAKAEITNGLKKATPFLRHSDPELARESLPAHPLNQNQTSDARSGTTPALVAIPITESDPPAGMPERPIEVGASSTPEIERPHVILEIEEEPVSIVGDGRQEREKLRPRLTPGLPLETNLSATPLQSQKLEQLTQVRDDTVAPLSPGQLNPGVESVAPEVDPNANPAQAIRPDREQVKPAPRAVRAVPVARNE